MKWGFYFLLPLAVIMFSLMQYFSSGILDVIIESEDIYQSTEGYIRYRSYGLFFVFANVLFRAFYVGIANTRVITWSTALLAAVNIFLDYALIFGNFGFPEMGIEGAALASVIAEVSATLYLVSYTQIIMLPAGSLSFGLFWRSHFSPLFHHGFPH